MNRLIIVPHTSGLIDYKGEDPALFGEIIKTLPSGDLVFDYTGASDATVWADYIDPRPEIVVTNISSTDPSFFYDAATGFVAVKAGVTVTITATITNWTTAMKWNTPVHRNGRLEGYIATSSDTTGNVTLTVAFTQMGLWELNQDIMNAGLPEDQWFLMKQGLTFKVSA